MDSITNQLQEFRIAINNCCPTNPPSPEFAEVQSFYNTIYTLLTEIVDILTVRYSKVNHNDSIQENKYLQIWGKISSLINLAHDKLVDEYTNLQIQQSVIQKSPTLVQPSVSVSQPVLPRSSTLVQPSLSVNQPVLPRSSTLVQPSVSVSQPVFQPSPTLIQPSVSVNQAVLQSSPTLVRASTSSNSIPPALSSSPSLMQSQIPNLSIQIPDRSNTINEQKNPAIFSPSQISQPGGQSPTVTPSVSPGNTPDISPSDTPTPSEENSPSLKEEKEHEEKSPIDNETDCTDKDVLTRVRGILMNQDPDYLANYFNGNEDILKNISLNFTGNDPSGYIHDLQQRANNSLDDFKNLDEWQELVDVVNGFFANEYTINSIQNKFPGWAPTIETMILYQEDIDYAKTELQKIEDFVLVNKCQELQNQVKENVNSTRFANIVPTSLSNEQRDEKDAIKELQECTREQLEKFKAENTPEQMIQRLSPDQLNNIINEYYTENQLLEHPYPTAEQLLSWSSFPSYQDALIRFQQDKGYSDPKWNFCRDLADRIISGHMSDDHLNKYIQLLKTDINEIQALSQNKILEPLPENVKTIDDLVAFDGPLLDDIEVTVKALVEQNKLYTFEIPVAKEIMNKVYQQVCEQEY